MLTHRSSRPRGEGGSSRRRVEGTSHRQSPPRRGPLPAAEQVALAVRGHRNGCAVSRARLVEANVGLVMSIARRFHCRALAFDDLVSEGMVGLIQAIDQFDPSRGVRFGSFAARVIERSIQRAVGEASGPVRLPPKARRLVARWRRAANRFQMIHGTPAEPRDLAPELGVSIEAARTLEHTDAALSGCRVPAESAVPDGAGNAGAPGRPAASRNPAADGSRAELIERVRAAIDHLDARSGAIVRMVFGLTGSPALSPRVIAEQTGLSVERVRHILERALHALRNAAEPGSDAPTRGEAVGTATRPRPGGSKAVEGSSNSGEEPFRAAA